MSLRRRSNGYAAATTPPATPKENTQNVVLEHIAIAESTARKYQALFPEIRDCASRELIEDTFSPSPASAVGTASTTAVVQSPMPTESSLRSPHWKFQGHDALLVDVRTSQERKVSMIAGAIDIDNFMEHVLPSLIGNESLTAPRIAHHSPQPEIIIMYCTVGFRSGMEARKLQNEYPSLFQQSINTNNTQEETGTTKIRIGNLDGIVNFANSNVEFASNNANLFGEANHSDANIANNSLLVDPKTQQPTMAVHVYGAPWKNCLSPEVHKVVIFSKSDFVWKSVRVGLRRILLSCKSCWK